MTCQPSTQAISLNCNVRHRLPHVPKHHWIGRVIWLSPDGILADVKWHVVPGSELPPGLDKLDNMQRLAKVNDWAEKAPKFSDPQRFPVNLIERMEEEEDDEIEF
jgi:hypothetical protein